MIKQALMLTAAGLTLASAAASAQDRGFYVAGNAGFALLAQSENSGDLTADAPLGLGAGTLSADAAYRFETDFDLGFMVSAAIGKESVYGPFRSELEVIYTRANVSDHNNFQALGGNLSGVDAGALTGAADPVGITIGRVLEDAQGSLSTLSFMINGFYDFTVPAANVHPYIGVGVGVTRVDVDFDPSGLGFADDDAIAFGYQAMAGVNYDVSARSSLRAGFRFIGNQGADIETDLIPSDLEVDANQFITELGWRVRF